MISMLRRFFIAGLLVWLPLGATVLVIKLLVDIMDNTLLLLPAAYRPEALFGFSIPGFGVVLSIVVVLVTGMIVANLFGRRLVRAWESLLARIPLVRSIYTAVKQVTETIFSSNGQSFRKVYLLEYPRRDLWTIGFQTGVGDNEVRTRTGQDLISIFIPTVPNPTTGFFFMVPRGDLTELDMTVEEGFKLILSMGVVMPEWTKMPVAGEIAPKIIQVDSKP